MTIPLIVIFLCGVGNFALHRWLMECGHPAQAPRFARQWLCEDHALDNMCV